MEKLSRQKPMRCDNSAPNCVEVAEGENGDRHIRDTKNPDQPPLRFTADEWDAFEGSIRAGQRF
ncbi:DUF397 domain-containing protein [Salinispora mooreana]|uniref:DUF397 domain-containing protein n=1 Tax=Salinispora mooreana TaxID=999545 RepID=UPI0003612A70|nr:DUF397 domain-containing protein [Salinispora mooreana]